MPSSCISIILRTRCQLDSKSSLFGETGSLFSLNSLFIMQRTIGTSRMAGSERNRKVGIHQSSAVSPRLTFDIASEPDHIRWFSMGPQSSRELLLVFGSLSPYVKDIDYSKQLMEQLPFSRGIGIISTFMRLLYNSIVTIPVALRAFSPFSLNQA